MSSGLSAAYIFGSILISEMAIVSRIQFVLRHMLFVEKLLILCGHFILQFMCFPSAMKPTEVLPPKWHWHWSRHTNSKVPEMSMLVLTTDLQQLWKHCIIKCLIEFVVVRVNSHFYSSLVERLAPVFLTGTKTIAFKLSASKVLDASVFICVSWCFALYSKY